MINNKNLKFGNESSSLGERIAFLRKERGLTLKEMSDLVGLPVSTLSKVQNNQATLNYHNLMKLALGLNVNISALFDEKQYEHQPKAGRRVITLAGQGLINEVDSYQVEVLASDLLNKTMHPGILTVQPADAESIGSLTGHAGEEFVYVLEGVIIVHSEDYRPITLHKGDSVYLDSMSGHKYVSATNQAAQILVICSGVNSETS